jgi:hypothetical protein
MEQIKELGLKYILKQQWSVNRSNTLMAEAYVNNI